MRQYTWASYSEGGFFHLARVEVKSDYPSDLHTHLDKAELFWVEDGFGTHLINGLVQPLRPGDLVFIRASDVHGFRTTKAQRLSFVNFSFYAPTLDYLQQRYFPDQEGWPWRPSRLPASFVLEPEKVNELRMQTEHLSSLSQTRLDLELFLLQMVHHVVGSQRVQLKPQPGQPLPPWLRAALVRFREPQHLSLGVSELARLCERSPEHLNRVLRRYCGKTTTAVIQDMRLEYAAQQLRMNNQVISKIARDCGLNNMSHFHQIFRRRFGISPSRYREREQSAAR